MSGSKRMYVGGRWVEARSGRTRSVVNPFDGQTLESVAEGDRTDAQDAIAAAREAFDRGPWPRMDRALRSALLRRLGQLVGEHGSELAEIESLNTGKTLAESRWDMDDVQQVFDYYAGLAELDQAARLDSPIPDSTSTLVREPVGVCGQILPWNYPLLQASWKMAPALAAGCTIVLKPSELTPLSTLRITELVEEAGFPVGVVNTVLGAGESVGAALAESPDVDLISFTGGVEVGKTIMRAASANLKRIALELGGKNPHIIFGDADLEVAIDFALNGVFFHAGQICSAGTRLMVHDSIHEQFVDGLRSRMARIVLGNGMHEQTQMGPLISEAQRERVERYVAAAIEEGAHLVIGGARPTEPSLERGFFYLPTLFRDCEHSMRIVQEEVFGPVITVEPFSSEDEVVALANDTPYGLSAGFWTRDSERICRVQRALRFGTVWVNDFNTYFARAPWGGFKQSGIGRELGEAGLDEYTELKHVFQRHEPRPLGWFGV